MLGIFVFIACLLGIFTLVLCAPYYLVKNLRYQIGIRTWIQFFYAEIFILIWVPDINIPMLGAHNVDGYVYLLVFVLRINEVVEGILHGRRIDFLLLLLLPLLPALMAQRAEFNSRAGKLPKE